MCVCGPFAAMSWVRETVNAVGDSPQAKTLKLAILGVSEVDTVEQLTSTMSKAERDQAITEAAVEVSMSRADDNNDGHHKWGDHVVSVLQPGGVYAP